MEQDLYLLAHRISKSSEALNGLKAQQKAVP